ncbi:MAG: hypothetical protein ACYC7F_10355 [Gemmatimonadaceae bacterium]
MMRRLSVLVAVMAGVSVASAQMPPSINKPIEQAKKNVAATNAQTAVASPAVKQAPGTKPAAQAPARQAGAPAKGTAKAPASAAPSGPAKDSNRISFDREVFAYVSEGRRDPFASPIETGEIRPLVSDLRLVGVIYDPAGRNSVAVMRDVSTAQQYRAKPGQMLGRARVSQIRPQEVVMTIEEYGFSRQEVLKLNVQQTQQTKGKP